MTERFWELIGRYWSGNISKEEKAELERLLLEHPDDWLKAGLAEQLSFRAEPRLSEAEVENLVEKTFGRISEQENPDVMFQRNGSRKKFFLLSLLLILAVATVGGSYWFFAGRSSGPAVMAWKTITTEAGMRTKMTLPDGTIIWLNAGSTLKYPAQLSGKREVYLKGEAYFDVKHNPRNPFIVHAKKMDVKVLGTELDIRAYPDEPFTETSLLQGSVEVDIKDGHEPQRVLLKPRQKLRLGEEKKPGAAAGKKQQAENGEINDNIQLQPIMPVDEENLIAETAWKEDKLVFRDETLEALCLRLERWYDVKIDIKDPTLAARRFTGRADNVSLDQLLHILQQITPFSYTEENKEVVIR